MERVRKNFAEVATIIEPPHLISMQRKSYEKFLQIDKDPDERENFGLQAILDNVFPINDFNGLCSLEFVRYSFGEPKYTVHECQQLPAIDPDQLVAALLTHPRKTSPQ